MTLISKWFVGIVVAALMATGAAPATAAPGMPWKAPAKIVSGVPVHVESIASCPAPPTSGDAILVQLTLSFGPAGSSGQILPASSDGSWSGDVTFVFSGVNIRQTKISAECLDFTGFSATPYARYQVRHTQVFG